MTLQNDSLRLLRHLSELRFEEELRGYSKSQVDRVLQKLSPMAGEIETLQSRLSEAETRAASAEARLMERGDDGGATPPPPLADTDVASHGAQIPATPVDFDETLRKTLVLAQRTADETVKEAYEEAERVTNNAHGEADLVLSKARAEADQLKVEAEGRHNEMITSAEADRDRLLDEATTAAETRKAELEAALNDAEGSERAELLEQITNLQEIRELLTTDIETLEAHLAGRRSAIQAALAELTRAIEDPGTMEPVAAPELAEVAAVDTADYEPVALTVAGLDEAVTIAPDEQPELGADLTDEVGSEESPSFDETDLDDQPDSDGDDLTAEASSTNDPEPTEAEDEPALSDDPLPVDVRDTEDAAGPAPDAAGPATQEFSLAELEEHDDAIDSSDDQALSGGPDGFTDSGVVSATATDPWAVEASVASDGISNRPAWVEAVPETGSPQPVSQDPFLEELRRATSDDRVDSDEALDRFLDGDEHDDRKSWFGRRR